MEEDETHQSMQAHLNEFNKLDQSLQDVNIELNDMLRMTVLLASLPPSYEHIVSAIETYIEEHSNDIELMEDEDGNEIEVRKGPDFDYVTRRLLNEEKKRRMNLTPGTDTALVSRAPKWNPHSKPALTCYKCGKKGHLSFQCHAKVVEDQNSGGETKANVVDDDYAF
jgi:hypothetical protein